MIGNPKYCMKNFRLLFIAGSLLLVINLVFAAIYLDLRPKVSSLKEEENTVVSIEPEVLGGKSPIKEDLAPNFIKVEKVKTAPEDSVYGDVMSHSHEAPFGDAHGRSTNVHETSHGINSWIRNKNTGNKRVNGFYVLQDRGILIDEMKFRKSQIAKFVPKKLRSFRFSMYVTGQEAWDDTPSYILDEWVCYVNGAKCNVEDVQKGKYRGEWTDGVSGALEFSIYSVAFAMAVESNEPQSFSEHLRSFLIWELRQSEQVFIVGRKMDKFKWDKQDVLLHDLLTSSEAEPMRKFIKDKLDGVWLDVDAEALDAAHYETYQRCPISKETEKVSLPQK